VDWLGGGNWKGGWKIEEGFEERLRLGFEVERIRVGNLIDRYILVDFVPWQIN
jgi:hypothetical protein